MKKLVKPSGTKQKAPPDATQSTHQAFIDFLKRPAQDNAGLKDLFSRAPHLEQQATDQTSPALTNMQDDMADSTVYVRKLRAPRF